MIVRVVENNTGKPAYGAMSCDDVICVGQSWIDAAYLRYVTDDGAGLVVAVIQHASGDIYELTANYAQRIEIFH